MHKTTRQIWTSSSSSATSCFFCDLQLLLTQPSCTKATPTARVIGSRTWTRSKTTSSTTRIVLQQLLEQDQKFALCHSTSTLPRQARSQKQSFCTYTTRAVVRHEGSTAAHTSSLQYQNASQGSQSTLPALRKPRTAMNSSRIPLQFNSRFLTTSTSTSVAPDLEADPSSPAHSAASSILTMRSIKVAPSPILSASSAIKETSSTIDFQTLFPEIPVSFSASSESNPFAATRSGVPWRNSSMSPGSELEERLRRSIYERESIDTWLPLYEQIAAEWRSPSWSTRTQGTALVRTDFVRIITALKVAPASCDSRCLATLERVLDDFHRVVQTSKSNVKVYDAFLETLRFWKMSDQVPRWVKRLKSRIMATSLSSADKEAFTGQSVQEQYHDLMSVLSHANQAQELLKCLEELKSSRSNLLQPTIKAYDTVLDLFMRNKETIPAMGIFHEMQKQGLTPQLTTFNILLRGHLENRDTLSTQRVFESLLLTDIRPDIYTFNLLMSGYLNMGEIELVNGFYKSLGEYGLVPNAKTYRILMKSYLRQGQADEAIDLFCKLKESTQAELQPGTEDYRVLIQVLASDGRMSDALRVLREMTESAKVPVTTSIYNVFLTHYAREGQIEKARRILDRIISENLPLVDGSINPLIRTYLEQQDLEKVGEMTELMNQYGVLPSRTTFNIMIDSTKSSGNLDGAMKLYERMVAEGVEPDVWTFNTLLDLLVGKLTPAQDNVKWKADSTAVTKEQIAEYVPRIETLLQDMKAKGIKPDVVTYGKLIQQYVILRDVEQAEMLFHEMVKSGISPNAHVFNMLMNGFTLIDDMDKAVELFRRMPKYGVEPDVVTFTTLIKGYANIKQLTMAQDFASAMQQQESSSRIRMDQQSLHTLMQLAQKSQNPGLALDFFEMMRGRGMEPDNVTFTILINALSRSFAASTGSKSKHGGARGRGRSTTGESGAVGGHGALLAESTVEAVESILAIIKQDGYPLHHAEITTMISAYFRLGRPLAAIEFFKTSFWRSQPKLSTTNCGALFNGLLAPEYGRRYDGIVLNLYLRMLEGTKAMIRAKDMEKESEQQQQQPPADPSGNQSQKKQTSWSSASSSSTASRPSAARTSVSPSSRAASERAQPNDFPVLDLVTINILLQAFSRRNNWTIVLQLWRDLESIGAENLHPFEMPLEFLGWAAQAYHLTPDREGDSVLSSRAAIKNAKDKDGHAGEISVTQKHARSAVETNAEMSEKLLKQLWNAHHWMGISWSYKIHGRNIFGSFMPATAATAPSGQSTASSTGSPGGSQSSSLLSSFLSDDATIRPNYRGGPTATVYPEGEGKKEDEERQHHQHHS